MPDAQKMYSFPVWRRLPFVALLLIVMVIGYAPATTQGTATLRLAAISAQSVVTHLFVGISRIQLHREGFLFQPNDTGWTTTSQAFPIIDLLSQTSQPIPQTIGSVPVYSGRYDAISISFTNATVFVAGHPRPVAAPPPLLTNVTLPISPNGVGDVLFLVTFDYSAIFANQPALSFILVSASAV